MASYKIIATILILDYVSILPSFGDEECFDLKGLVPPVFTPFDCEGNLNLKVIPQYAQYLAENDVNGVLLTGTAGEGPTLSVEEVKEVISAWISAARPHNIKIIAQIGGRPIADVKELARYAENIEVDAVLVLPELYYKPDTVERLVYYLEVVALAAPKTPMMYYHIPEMTNVDVDMAAFSQLATKSIHTFKGMKTGLQGALRAYTVLKMNQTIFISNSMYLEPAVLMGFDSFIMTEINLFPQMFHDVINNGKRCNLNETRSQYEAIIDLSNTIRSVISSKDSLPAIKAAMYLVTGIDVGPVRAPHMALTDAQNKKLKEKLKKKGVYNITRNSKQ